VDKQYQNILCQFSSISHPLRHTYVSVQVSVTACWNKDTAYMNTVTTQML